MNIDQDKNALPAVSCAIGHSSAAMTEKNYGRIDPEKLTRAQPIVGFAASRV
jgi:hypothetical protein